MKIIEVEAQVGITRKNIRFYEEQGLLSPRRNSENGYREYGEAEVGTLRQIKLLRKLGVPLEEIRRMQSGGQTVADGMRRHLITLARERENIDRAMELCAELKEAEIRLTDLDAAALLDKMEQLEQAGTAFVDKQRQDVKPMRYLAPILIAVAFTLLLGGVMALFLWAFLADSTAAPPLPVVVTAIALPLLLIAGVLLALVQRLKEIGKGEEDEARKY